VSISESKAYYNWLSLTGFIITANCLILILVLFVMSVLSTESNSYLGLFIYIILPAFMVLGLLLIPLGVMINVRRKKNSKDGDQPWPVFDLNKRGDWATLVKIFLITLIFITSSAIGSYKAFEYSESVEFCGTVCHDVMEPEFVTYQHSAHARVTCVECHVGKGADWYAKSKLSGLYQIYSVVFKKYSTPIVTPIYHLRPERATCERCHWPEKFYSRKLRIQRSYLADSSNTEWNVSLLMKIGPEFSPLGLTEGIHWHINKNFRIEYAAASRDRESIPWVKLTNLKTGEVKTFFDETVPQAESGKSKPEIRTMDCMDCHNRPSHLFKSPQDYLDIAFISGMIPKDIPYFKKAAMEALKDPFATQDSAMHGIETSILSFYGNQYPAILQKRENDLKKGIRVLQEQYSQNAFPKMKADASHYPNHIGHLETEGCFRCHSGNHKTASGETISRNCDLCHTIIAQGPTGNIENAYMSARLDFKHPTPVGDKWQKAFCSECHKNLYE
jgi:hypothetical protein